MRQWYALKRGQGLSDLELLTMTAEERKWWVAQIERENEIYNKNMPGRLKS